MEMQNKIKEMEEKVKEYEKEAEQQLGKHVLKEWNIKSDVDSETVYEVVSLLQEEAQQLIEEKKNETKEDGKENKGLGKSEKQDTQTTP